MLAVSKKIVIRVEDLVKWACPEPSGWKRNARKDGAPDSIGILLSDQPQGASVQSADSAQGRAAMEGLETVLMVRSPHKSLTRSKGLH